MVTGVDLLSDDLLQVVVILDIVLFEWNHYFLDFFAVFYKFYFDQRAIYLHEMNSLESWIHFLLILQSVMWE